MYSTDLVPDVYQYDQAPRAMREAAREFAARFGVRFDTLTHLSPAHFRALHQVQSTSTDPRVDVAVASESDPSVLADMRQLTLIANQPFLSKQDRQTYFSRLLTIYGKLPRRPRPSDADSPILLGIEREGRILAESLDWYDHKRVIALHAKRIPYRAGLLVGLERVPLGPGPAAYTIVDGAIASGATVIAVANSLAPGATLFDVYSVHATAEGISAIVRFARSINVPFRLTVGHVTQGLNDHYYAVEEGSETRLVVGDLGDTIAELILPSKSRAHDKLGNYDGLEPIGTHQPISAKTGHLVNRT